MTESNEYPIEYVGINNQSFQSLVQHEWEKIMRKFDAKIKEPLSLKVHTKEYHKDGGQSKFSITVHLYIAQVALTTTADDWDLQAALKQCFDALVVELEKRYAR